MIRELSDSKKVTAAELEALDSSLASEDFLAVAQEFHKRSRPDQFVGFLREHLDPDDIVQSETHQKALAVGFRGIITTNFDRVFENQVPGLVPLVYPQCLESVSQFQEAGFFAKIHGCIRASSDPYRNLVLTDESYRQLRQDRKYHAVLQALLTMHTLLTVGFSLADPDLLGILEDLQEVFGDTAPTLYSLMLDPGQEARDTWRHRGVEIIPYDDHSTVVEVLNELLSLTLHETKTASGDDLAAQLVADSVRIGIAEYQATLEASLGDLHGDDRVGILLRLYFMLGPNRRFEVLPSLLSAGTEEARQLAITVLKEACETNRISSFPVDAARIPVRTLAIETLYDVGQPTPRALLSWLFRDSWAKFGVDLASSAESLATELIRAQDTRVIEELVQAIEGESVASKALGRMADAMTTAPSDATRRRFIQEIRLKLMVAGSSGYVVDSRGVISAHLAGLDEGPPWDFAERVVRLLLNKFVTRRHLTLHGSSSLYDPELADEVVDALSEIEKPDTQRMALHAILGWYEANRGLGSRTTDYDDLIRGLYVPLWWRYSSEARLAMLENAARFRLMGDEPKWLAGQDYMLQLMGLSYDADEDFRRTFVDDLWRYQRPKPEPDESLISRLNGRYEPRILQEVWRPRELTYRFEDGVPPELIRRAATGRTDWSRQRDSSVRWDEATALAQELLEAGDISQLVSAEQGNVVVNGLLCFYDGSEHEVILYPRVLQLVSTTVGVEPRYLDSIAFAHGTARAYLHLGRDLCFRRWNGAGASSIRPTPGPTTPPSMDCFAQFYTHHVATSVGGQLMLQAFELLERCGGTEVTAWRAKANCTLEQIRASVIQIRELEYGWAL